MTYPLTPILWDRATVQVMAGGTLRDPIEMPCLIQRDHVTKLNTADHSLSLVLGGRGFFAATAGLAPGSQVSHRGKVYTVTAQKLHSLGGVPHHEEVIFG